jgi:hypothetical protein
MLTLTAPLNICHALLYINATAAATAPAATPMPWMWNALVASPVCDATAEAEDADLVID